MIEFQLPTKEVDYLKLAFPATGQGLIARWGTQFTPFTVGLWKKPSKRLAWKFTDTLDIGQRLQLSADGQWMSYPDETTREMRITRVGDRQPTHNLPYRGKEQFLGSAVAPGGEAIAWKEDSRIIVQGLPNEKPIAEIKSGWGYDLRFSGGGRWLTEVGKKVFRVFDRSNHYKAAAKIKTINHQMADVADEPIAVVTFPDRSTVTVWDILKNKAVAKLSVGGWMCLLVISSDGRRILTGNTDGDLTLWDAEGSKLRTYDWGIETPIAGVFSRDGTRAAVGGTDGRIVVWDLDD